MTDINGEAEIDFFCSDINSEFQIVVEGVGDGGILGRTEGGFYVSKTLPR